MDIAPDMLVRVFRGYPVGGERLSRLNTILLPFTDLANWIFGQLPVTALQQQVATTQQQLAAATTLMAALTQRMAAAESAIGSLTGQESQDVATITALSQQVAAAIAANAALTTRVSQDEASLVTLTGTEAADAQAIAALQARFPASVTALVPVGILGIGKTVRTVSGLAGIRKGDRILVTPTIAVPTPYTITSDTIATADGVVQITLDVLVALTVAGSTLPVVLTPFR